MAKRDIDRLRRYFNLISKASGGPDVLIENFRASSGSAENGGIESAPVETAKFDAGQRAIESLAIGLDVSDDNYFAAEAIINAELRPGGDA